MFNKAHEEETEGAGGGTSANVGPLGWTFHPPSSFMLFSLFLFLGNCCHAILWPKATETPSPTAPTHNKHSRADNAWVASIELAADDAKPCPRSLQQLFLTLSCRRATQVLTFCKHRRLSSLCLLLPVLVLGRLGRPLRLLGLAELPPLRRDALHHLRHPGFRRRRPHSGRQRCFVRDGDRSSRGWARQWRLMHKKRPRRRCVRG